jgi:hypothetical protein
MLVRSLQRTLNDASSEATKAWWERYLKDAIQFRGVGIQRIRSAVATWRASTGIDTWPVADQFSLAVHLLERPIAADKLAGVLFLEDYLIGQVPWRKALGRYESLYRAGSIFDWNTCDWFGVKVLGPTIAAYGPPCAKAVSGWNRASDVWPARSSVVAFVEANLAQFSPESFKNALRYLPQGRRRGYLGPWRAAQKRHAAALSDRRR